MGLQSSVMQIEAEATWIYSKWVQPPAQNRSAQTFFRFLDAAEELLAKRHWHEVSVQEIVRKAKASVGSFYNRFNDKAALLHCLDDRLGQECELLITHLIEELETYPALMKDGPAIVITILMRLCTERRGLIRALDLADKMSASDTFSGLGPRFDAALEGLAYFFTQNNPALSDYTPEAITRAFREVFWIARESLLYERGACGGQVTHQNLLHHFEASLSKPNVKA